MSAPEFVTVFGAITALIIAVTGLYVEVRRTHELVNSRMTQLLELTQRSAMAQGRLEQRPGDISQSGNAS